jgi:hypothetical protein
MSKIKFKKIYFKKTDKIRFIKESICIFKYTRKTFFYSIRSCFFDIDFSTLTKLGIIAIFLLHIFIQTIK